ncbi:MAG: YitT family protein [Oscillospiraceae bacterium]|nr:YitT family protein [Oscillospiraceae bacterium]
MYSPKGKKRRSACLSYLFVIVGAAILSFGLYNVHRQSGITEGGILGMTLLLDHWFHISPSISGFIMDGLCYIIGYRFLGKTFAKYSIIATAGFCLFYRLWSSYPPVLPVMQPLTAAVVGACFVGVGVGLIVREGGASGGDDALALVIAHLTKRKISFAYLFTDLVVLTLSVTYIPMNNILSSLVTVSLSSWIIGLMHREPENKSAAARADY